MRGSAPVAVAAELDHDDVDPPEPSEPVTEPVDDDTDKPPKEVRDVKEPKDKAAAREAVTSQVREIRAAEDQSLKDILDGLGTDGAFKIHVRRLEPEEWTDPQTGRRVKTAGVLKTYTQRIDEEFLADRHGGGRYQLKFTRRTPKGSYEFYTQRTVDIAGDPRVDDVPRTVGAPNAAPAPTSPDGHPSIVREAFGVLREQLDRERDREAPAAKGIDPAMQLVLEQMRGDAARRDREMTELRAELSQARNHKPAEDPLKERLMDNLITSKSGEVEALRLRQEAELRMTKESAAQDEKRLHDRFDRDMAAMNASYQREITALKASHDVSHAAAKGSFELQVKLLESDIKRLERDNASMRDELKDLRARKDKGILEQVKDLATIKEALLDDDDGAAKTGFDKAMDLVSSPGAAEFVKGIMGKAEQAPAAPAQPTKPTGPRFVRSADGQTFAQTPDNRLIPIKRKPKVIPPTHNPDGTVATPAIEMPEVDPAQVAIVVGYLEKACAGKQDPEVVAQSGRSLVPEEVLTWIRANDTEAVSGVDLFMSKVAKLPSTSPLSTQSGRNWLRKVGKALVGA